MKVRFHHLATGEMRESARYYERQCTGLGAAFLGSIQTSIAFLKEHPEGAQAVSRDVRRKLIDRFPYALVYAFEGGEILILAVANLRRRPFYWKDRISGGEGNLGT
jgi:plasmid stabilization system protein ParE